jgi:hypothetical protein
MKNAILVLLFLFVLGGCEMRTAADVERAKATLIRQQTDAVIQALPPGFVSGLKLSLNKEHKIAIGKGIINVNGKQVVEKTGYTITEGDWLCSMIQGYWYYLYISDTRQYYIDVVSPVFSSDLYAYYHPTIINYRNIGKLYVHETYRGSGKYKPIYVQSKLETESTTVIVASSTYEGDNANYYCDGAEDNIFINAAASFLYNAYNGGTVKLLSGIFEITQSIYLKPGIILDGEGWSTIISGTISTTYKINATGTSVSDNKLIKISNLFIDNEDNDEYASGIYVSLLSKIIIENVKFNYLNTTVIFITTTASINIKECSIDNTAMLPTSYSYLNRHTIWIDGNAQSDAIINISNNKFSNNDGLGIGLLDIKEGTINSNYFYNQRWRCIYCYSDVYNLKIINNNFIDCNIFQAPDDYYGINLSNNNNIISNNIFNNNGKCIQDAGGNNIINGNTAVNCGNLIDRSTCRHTNPPMIIGETVPITSNATFVVSTEYYREIETFWYHYILAPDNDYKHYSFIFTKTNAAGTEAYASLVDAIDSADLHGMTAEKEIVFSAWVYVPTDSPVALSDINLRIGEYYGGAWNFTQSNSPLIRDSWQQLTVTITLNVAITGFIIDIYNASTAPINSIFYLDDFRLYVVGLENYLNQIYYDSTGTSTNIGNSWN